MGAVARGLTSLVLIPGLALLLGDDSTALAVPPEVSGLTWCAGSATCLQWSAAPGATHYRLYRGEGASLACVMNPSFDSCLEGTYTTATTAGTITAVPANGSLFWYLVTALDGAGEGAPGAGTGGPRVVNDTGSCTPVCAPAGASCVDNSACCSFNCSNGFCRTNCCEPTGASCTLDAQCCYHACAAGTCRGPCATSADCPLPASECEDPACVAGVCGTTFKVSGVPASTQTTGDCQRAVCDGSGGVSSIADDNDVPTEGGECTSATCVAGVPSYSPLQLDAPCTENGGVVCDGNGTCVQCNVAAQCPAGPVCTVAACRAGACHQEQVAAGTPCSSGGTVCDGSGACVPCLSASDCPPSGSECEVSTCTANACGTTSQPYGLPLSLQTEGDCRTEICDGTGGVTSAPDDNDIPSGGSQCSSATCMNGTPAYFPNPAGSACDENGGRVCDGSGSCVSCNVAADCPAGPDECSIAVCSSNACSLNNAPVGVPCGNGGTCDGAGNCL